MESESKPDHSLYLPDGVTPKTVKIADLVGEVKIKAQEASSLTLQLQLQIKNQWVNLANIDLKTHEVNFEYPYYLWFNQGDKDFLILYAYKNKLFKIRSPRNFKVSKLKKESGAEAQKVGALFEQVCVQKLNSKNSFRNQVVEKIIQDYKLNPETTQVSFIHQGEKMVSTVDNGKVLPKSDILVTLNDLSSKNKISLGISAKKTNLATQVHITSVDSLKNNLKLKYQVTMPKIVETALKKFAGVDGYTPRETLDPIAIKQLSQGNRNRFLLHELTAKEQNELKSWMEDNLQVLLSLAVAEGSVLEDQFHAQYLIINQKPYTNPEDWNPSLQPIKEVISQAKKEGVSFSEAGGSIKLGSKVTLQMKGSGTANQRSCLQFKKSI